MTADRYSVHRYIGKKPYTLVADIIRHVTREGDIVLDPFVGSGTTACEALILRRRAAASDIDPFAAFLTKMLCISPIDIKQLKDAYERVSSRAWRSITDLYTLEERCTECGEKLVSHWVTRKPCPEPSTKKGCLVGNSCLAKSVCPKCKNWSKAGIRRLTEAETQSIEQIESNTTPSAGRGIDTDPETPGDWLIVWFSPRNLEALKILYRAITRESGDACELLKYAFSANLAKSSLLNTVRNTGKRWILNDPHNLSVPDYPFEFNVWMGFENRSRDLFKAKAETNQLIGSFYNKDSFSLHISSVTKIGRIGEEAVDHIVTDPPYSESISYSKLHMMNRIWLGLGDTLEKEIKLAKVTSQKTYLNSMHRSLTGMARALRTGGSLTILIEHTTKAWKAYRLILKAAKEAKTLSVLTTTKTTCRGREYLLLRCTRTRTTSNQTQEECLA